MRNTEPENFRRKGNGSGPRSGIFEAILESDRLEGILEGQESAIGEVVVLALRAGLGVLLSPTRYGSAVSVSVWEGEQLHKAYASSPEELTLRLDAITRRARTLAGDPLTQGEFVAVGATSSKQ